jgi:hypothetical protein
VDGIIKKPEAYLLLFSSSSSSAFLIVHIRFKVIGYHYEHFVTERELVILDISLSDAVGGI